MYSVNSNNSGESKYTYKESKGVIKRVRRSNTHDTAASAPAVKRLRTEEQIPVPEPAGTGVVNNLTLAEEALGETGLLREWENLPSQQQSEISAVPVSQTGAATSDSLLSPMRRICSEREVNGPNTHPTAPQTSQLGQDTEMTETGGSGFNIEEFLKDAYNYDNDTNMNPSGPQTTEAGTNEALDPEANDIEYAIFGSGPPAAPQTFPEMGKKPLRGRVKTPRRRTLNCDNIKDRVKEYENITTSVAWKRLTKPEKHKLKNFLGYILKSGLREEAIDELKKFKRIVLREGMTLSNLELLNTYNTPDTIRKILPLLLQTFADFFPENQPYNKERKRANDLKKREKIKKLIDKCNESLPQPAASAQYVQEAASPKPPPTQEKKYRNFEKLIKQYKHVQTREDWEKVTDKERSALTSFLSDLVSRPLTERMIHKTEELSDILFFSVMSQGCIENLMKSNTPNVIRRIVIRLDETGRQVPPSPPSEKAALADRKIKVKQQYIKDILEGLKPEAQNPPPPPETVAQDKGKTSAIRAPNSFSALFEQSIFGGITHAQNPQLPGPSAPAPVTAEDYKENDSSGSDSD